MRWPRCCARRAPRTWWSPTSATCSRAPTRSTPSWKRGSLPLDVGGPDDRPPLLDLGALEGRERLHRLLLGRRNLLAHVDEPPADRRIVHRRDRGSVEP